MEQSKSPWLAGILSVVPGAGQMYNEQYHKGAIILFILFTSTFLWIAELIPKQHTLLSPLILHSAPWETFCSMSAFFPDRETYFLLWLFVLVPFLYIYSLVDAVQSARQINRQYAAAGWETYPDEANNQGLGAVTMLNQNLMRSSFKKKQTPLESQAKQPWHPWLYNPQEEGQPLGGQAGPATPPPLTPPPPPKGPGRCARMNGKFLLGMILLFAGLVGLLNFLDVDVFSWSRLWPILVLIPGLRLLGDYNRSRDRGQLILGAILTAIGVLFGLENWGFGDPIEFMFDFWWLIFLVGGSVIILSDLAKKKRNRRFSKR